jgi:hypothetical protein
MFWCNEQLVPLKAVNKKTMLPCVAAAVLLTWVFSSSCAFVNAQTAIAFTQTDQFRISENNSTINFAPGGTYTQATLQNGSWIFLNLHLNNSGNNDTLESFKVSAKDSNMTITSCQKFSGTTTAGERLRYTVIGHGEQAFNFGIDLKSGEWSVVLNGRQTFISEKENWHITPDGTITVTGATVNATISYYILPPGFGSVDTSNQTFYEQHSVAIVTGASVAFALVLVVLIRQTNQRRHQKALVDIVR